MKETVVCAFDPETAELAPLELARMLAGVLDAQVLIVAVRPGGTAPARLARAERSAGSRRTIELLRGPPRRERPGMREVVAASASAGLHAVLEREAPVLAVLGSAHSAEHGAVGLGGTTERMLDGAPCPVAIAPRGYTERSPAAIGVAVLPSPEGRAALAAAAALACAADVPLQVLLVLSESPDTGEAIEIARQFAPPPRDAQGAAAILRAALAGAAHAAAGSSLHAEAGVFVGDPADTLVRASANVDLLLLGSRAYGPARTVLIGGVARRVLAGARCPVLLVPRPAVALRRGALDLGEAVGA
jgi:nucleotide-binding universal stress UspA family protein